MGQDDICFLLILQVHIQYVRKVKLFEDIYVQDSDK